VETRGRNIKEKGRREEERKGTRRWRRACFLARRPRSQTGTNGLFHARSAALTRRRYSVRSRIEPISIIRRFLVPCVAPPVPLPPSPGRTLSPRLPARSRARAQDARTARDRTNVRARCHSDRSIDRSVRRIVRYSVRLNSTGSSLPFNRAP